MENMSPFSCHDTETLKTTMPQISLDADADLFILDAKLFLQLQQSVCHHIGVPTIPTECTLGGSIRIKDKLSYQYTCSL